MAGAEIEPDKNEVEFLTYGRDFYAHPPFSEVFQNFYDTHAPHGASLTSTSGVQNVLTDLPYMVTLAAEVRKKSPKRQEQFAQFPYVFLPAERRKAAYNGEVNRGRLLTLVTRIVSDLDIGVLGWDAYVREQLLMSPFYTKSGAANRDVFRGAGTLPLSYAAWSIQQGRIQPPGSPPATVL